MTRTHTKNRTENRTTISAIGATLAALALTAAMAGTALAAPSTSKGDSGVSGKVNLNTASLKELSMLPGIGPSKAEAIVKRRAKRPFRRPEEIMRVRGIGRSTFRRLRNHLAVKGANTIEKRSSSSTASGKSKSANSARRKRKNKGKGKRAAKP